MPHPTVNPFLWFEPGQAELAAGNLQCLLTEIRLGLITYTLMGAPGRQMLGKCYV